ncbi:uncharacterized protein LOC110449987 [Mizuhopecten yessoensis]|uniref:Ig-like domain-containing protein n=1 Tax=Mizuhopecten yessoensis TaxID=6573 RepID=A0A210QPZ6_MIZYE|nr:uncharacterized protein LOC110449987 [Mizuhopecten yessoensis]OWF50805.1 hypothetical protein KP79_PYT00811 [Mizuhopecten yessoensis]
MFLFTLLISTILQVAVRGTSIRYVPSYSPVTLTCPADDQATDLTWRGPGYIQYFIGTTVAAGLSGIIKSRVSARHTGGNYTLTLKGFRYSDEGLYKCTVDGTEYLQMIIKRGRIQTTVYVQISNSVTLTCPADDQVSHLNWSKDSAMSYVWNTTVRTGLSDSIKSRISARHTGGRYTLTLTEFRSSDVGYYQCEVDDIFYTHYVYLLGIFQTWTLFFVEFKLNNPFPKILTKVLYSGLL